MSCWGEWFGVLGFLSCWGAQCPGSQEPAAQWGYQEPSGSWRMPLPPDIPAKGGSLGGSQRGVMILFVLQEGNIELGCEKPPGVRELGWGLLEGLGLGQGCGGERELVWGLAIGSAGGADSPWSTRMWEPGGAWVGLSNWGGWDPLLGVGAAGSQPSKGPVSPQDEMWVQWLGQCIWPGRGVQAGNVAGIITGRQKARVGQGLQQNMCSDCSPVGTNSEPRGVVVRSSTSLLIPL